MRRSRQSCRTPPTRCTRASRDYGGGLNQTSTRPSGSPGWRSERSSPGFAMTAPVARRRAAGSFSAMRRPAAMAAMAARMRLRDAGAERETSWPALASASS